MGMNTAYSITSKGQVTVPKALRDAVGITPAHRVTFHRRGQDIIIRKTPTLEEVSAELRKKYAHKIPPNVTQKDYNNARAKFEEQGGVW
jgi:AbrB family looped-hinge helix DNA binding protein